MMFYGTPELVDFETEGGEHWITLRLKDGSVIKVKMEVTAVLRLGNDPNTGLPIYAIQSTNVIRMVSVPKELIKKKPPEAYG
ncbi:MAG: hypothetical protein ACP5LW_05890 [Nitrososphaeria archaeon]|jgi:hypothetical protein